MAIKIQEPTCKKNPDYFFYSAQFTKTSRFTEKENILDRKTALNLLLKLVPIMSIN